MTLWEYYKAAGLKNPPTWSQDVILPKTPMAHQIKRLSQGLRYTRFKDMSEPGCVSADTEYLTPTGWRRIDSYDGTGKVAQFYPDTQEIEFVEPLDYIKAPCNKMLSIHPVRSTSQKLSLEHNMLLYSPNGNHIFIKAWDFYVEYSNNGASTLRRQWQFCTTFKLKSQSEGLPYTDAELRVLVAQIADGHFAGKATTLCRFRLKKTRKIERLKALLDCAGIAYKERLCPAVPGFHIITFYSLCRDKSFTERWWSANQHQLEVIAGELPYWDGSVSSNPGRGVRFFSTVYKTAEFAQYAFSASGKRASYSFQTRERRGSTEIEHNIQVSAGKRFVSAGRKESVSLVSNDEGFKYCFSVPTKCLLLRHNGHIFATGNTGKSLPAAALALARASAGNKVIYLTQPNLTEQFVLALNELFPGHPLSVEIFRGTPDERQIHTIHWDETQWPDILVMSYRMFVGYVPPKKWSPNARTPRAIEFTNWETFLEKGYSMLIVDEAVAVKESTSQIHQAVAGFAGPAWESNGLYLMTGSPVNNNPRDAFGLIHLVEPSRYSTERNFDDTHLVYDDFGKYKKIIGYDNLDYLNESLMRFGDRVTKREVLDLPEISYVDVPVTLSSKHKELYRQIVDEQMLEFPDGTMLDFTQTQKLYQACQRVLVCPESVAKTKVKQNELLITLDEILETLKGYKVMVGVWYQDSITSLLDRYKRLNPTFINGTLSSSKVEEMKNKFIQDETCQVIFTNYRSGGVGVDGLQKVCSYAVMLEMVSVPGWLDQWVSRLHRSGQKDPITVYLVYARGTIAAKLRRDLFNKDEINNLVVKDKKQLLKELFDVR